MPNRKTPRRSNAHAELKRLEHRIQGVAIRGAADPPPVQLSPWYNLTVSLETALSTTATVYTPTSIRAQILSQLGQASDLSYIMRVREVRVWGPLGGSIKCVFYDYTNGSILTETSDVGSLNNRPRCGYVWPTAISTRTVGASANDLLTITSGSTAVTGTTSCVIRFLCQIRLIPSA